MEPPSAQRKLTAILSADAKDYSRLMNEDEEGTIRTLTAYREVMIGLIQQYRGKVVDSPGDNLLTEFASAVDAVQSAIAIQQALTARNAQLPLHRRMEFRLGINVGDVVVDGGRLYGDGVNIAARLEGLAEGGGIYLSGTVYDQVAHKLPLAYEDLGEQWVKNIARPVRVYRIRLEPGAQPHPSKGMPQQNVRALHVRDKPAIAVLPFTNMSGDSEQEYFSDGITEDLITALSKLSGLFVISRNSSFFYKGKAVKPKEISRELGVRYVLEGSVRKAGNRLRITAQLIDATTGYHLWAERYDRDLRDIFALQDEVTQQIMIALAVKLTYGEQKRLAHIYTDNLEAYDYYLRGDAAYQPVTKDTPIQARRMYERAIELDPQFAAAYASLSTTYLLEWDLQWSQDPEALERAFELAQKAIGLDDTLSLAHSTLGGVYLCKRQHERAIAEGEKAILLDPNSASAYSWLGFSLNFSGRPEDTPALVEKAIRLNPHYPPHYLFTLGHAYYLMGRSEEALVTLKRVVNRNPDHLSAHAYLAVLLGERGRREDSRVAVATVLRISPQFSVEVARQRALSKDPSVLERYIAGLRRAGLQ